MIEVQNLTKRYPTRVAVDDVTFSVKSGEIVGFLGPNGAGKTTTMRVLTGFLPPTSGSARVAGHDIVTDSRKAREAVGYLPESAALYPEMRVTEFLAYRARLEGVRGAAVRERVSEAVERCLLSEVAGRRIENLSKGFRQRTSLAGALVHQPPVLVLDEPTVGLDPMQIIKIRETIRALGKERAVLLSTHILPEVDAVCDRILIISEGRIVAEGTVAQLRQKFAEHPVLSAAFRGAVPAREALAQLPGVTSVEEHAGEKETRVRLECEPDADPSEAVFQMAVSKGWVLRELSRDQLSLEEVFVRLTQRQPAAAEPAPPAAEPAAEAPAGEEPASSSAEASTSAEAAADESDH
jgi:ABC-2 type transport system ATP-binding protein